MDNPQRLRPIGIGFLCCGLGLLTGGVVAGELTMMGTSLAFTGLGVVFLARSRQAD